MIRKNSSGLPMLLTCVQCKAFFTLIFMSDMQAEIDLLVAAKPMLGWWLHWMIIIVFLSIVFVWKHKAARWTLLSMVGVFPTAMLIYKLTGNINLVGISHLIFWIPLWLYLWQNEVKKAPCPPKSIYGAWIMLLFATISVSLVFDVYDVLMVSMGQK